MILVLNCGSQSIKWKLFKESLKVEKSGKREVFNKDNYLSVLREELSKIKKFGNDIEMVGHRVVHGGEKFRKATRITEEILKKLEDFNKLAPLHNPFNLLGIKSAREIFASVPQIAVFDTEFFTNLPERSRIYALPENLRNKYGFMRFGFHGISHEYVAKEAAKIIKKPFNKLKIITCHLGGGSSIAAIKGGRAIDTSMGFTPLEGVVMMTRSGSIDPGIILELARDFPIQKLDQILNFESGLKGICGIGEMLGVLKAIQKKNKKAKMALDIFVYHIQKYIGAYFGVMGGCDLLIFTGTIGVGSSKIRRMICKNLNILRNTRVLSLQTDEELAVAQKIRRL